MSAAGPATSPMTTAPRPLSTRARIAVRLTPMRRLVHPARAAPTAKTAQPPAATGPMMAPARSSPPTSSASRIGWKVSKTIIADRPEHLDEDDAAQHPVGAAAGRARHARRPGPPWPRRARGEARGVDVSARGAPRAARGREQVHDVEDDEDDHRQQQRRRAGEGVPPDERHPTRGRRRRCSTPSDGALGGERPVDVGAGRGRVHGVDEPRLERSGVERPEDARQHGGGEEGPEGLGDDEHARSRRR